MKPLLRLALALAVVCLAGGEARAQATFTKEQLREDFALLRRALTELHPGLYRYSDEATVRQRFDEFGRGLRADMTRAEAYLAFSRLLAAIRCGHTYCNFWNQPAEVRREVLDGPGKLPFTFRLVGRRMIVVENASEEARVRRGTEILAVNGVGTPRVLDALLRLVKGDGANDGKRLRDLQVTGDGEFEAFDVYFPLLFPARGGAFTVRAADAATGRTFTFRARAVSRAERAKSVEARYGRRPATADDLWRFEFLGPETAYLRLGTFAVWKMKKDWRAFLRESFAAAAAKGATSLVLDIRGNEGGADEVNAELSQYLVSRPARPDGRRMLLRYDVIPASLDPYLKSWDDSFRDRRAEVSKAGGGFFELRGAGAAAAELRPGPAAFRGDVYLLVDAANSSATFYLASMLKRNGLATLVGQTTGGNLRGTNGGRTAFLVLPHTRVEVDIPLVGTYPLGPEPDGGLAPDVFVRPTVAAVASGADAELEAVRRLISGRRASGGAPRPAGDHR